MNSRQLCISLGAAMVLGACGGGNDAAAPSAPAAADTVPASALASASAYTEYVGTVVRSERDDAIKLGDADAPVSDSEAPLPVT